MSYIIEKYNKEMKQLEVKELETKIKYFLKVTDEEMINDVLEVNSKFFTIQSLSFFDGIAKLVSKENNQ
ncbi:MAG: hypothetical protein ACRCUP_01250 [Mycoplasmatales bacterium]